MKFKLFYNIREHLKEKIGEGHEPGFLRDIESKTLDQILYMMNNYPNRDYQGLMATYAFEVLRSLKHDADNIEHLIEAHNIVKKSTELQESCYYELDSILAEYIMGTKSLPQLFSISGIAMQIKNLNENYKESYICTGNQFVSLLYDCINEIYKNPSEERALEGAKYLKSFIKRGFDVVFVADLFCDTILTFIKKRNQLFNESEYGIPVNVQSDLKIIDNMMRCKLSEDNINDLKKCEEILLGRGQREVKKKDLIKDFVLYKISKNLDENLLEIIKEIARANTDTFTVKFNKATFDRKNIILKEYTLNNSANSSFDGVALQNFENEAKCYDFLHNKFNKGPHPSKFVKFYGCSVNNKSFKLAYEDFGDHLGFYISDMLKMNKKIKQNLLWDIVKDLIDAFTELENLNIYHQNISLSSIKIDDYLKIKIIDFEYAVVDESSWMGSNKTKGQMREMYYWPKMVKYSKGKLGKQDVFALGLVILQLSTFQSIDGPKNYKYLKSAIEEVIDKNLADLLKNMLLYKSNEWLRFKNLENTYFREGSTASLLSSHKSSNAPSDFNEEELKKLT